MLQADPGALDLYKHEWRRAELMRTREERLLPNVLRAAFPPEAAPHSLASNPPPSHVTPPHSRQLPPKPLGMAFGALDPRNAAAPPKIAAHATDASEAIAAARYFPGRPFDWSPNALNDAQRDFKPLRSNVTASAARAPFGARREITREGRRGNAVAAVVMDTNRRPATTAVEGSVLQGVQSRGHSYGPPRTQQAARALRGMRSQSPQPLVSVDFGRWGHAAKQTNCISDHNTYLTRELDNQADSSPQPAAGSDAPGFASAADTLRDPHLRAERAQLAASCVAHLHDTAASLRSYSVSDPAHRQPTALSQLATTFARPPKAPHVADAALASPSERIAANLCPSAWGLSPRTLQHISPAALREEVGQATEHAQEALAATAGTESWEADTVAQEARKQMVGLPLELFDDVEFETRTAEEWVALGAAEGGTPAVTSWFSNSTGATEQRSVRVLAYNARDRTYNVRFARSGVEKRVRRLNLCFNAEDAQAFARRVAAARAVRAEHEAILRWRFVIDTNDAEDVVDTYDFDAKTDAVRSTCPGVSDAMFAALKQELIEDFHGNYQLAVRIASFNYHRSNPKVAAAVHVLRLPPPPVRVAAPQQGVLAVVAGGQKRSAEYDALRAAAHARMFLASPPAQARMQVCDVARASAVHAWLRQHHAWWRMLRCAGTWHVADKSTSALAGFAHSDALTCFVL